MKIIITEEQKNNLFVLNEVRVKESDRVKLYEDDKLLVVVPLTHKASCKYGANTPWCVAVPSEDEHFNEYRGNGVLIYFIVKSPYEYGDIKEYKFAYYYSYNKDESEGQEGWYDMSDYRYGEENGEDERNPDKKLIQFLIPKKIFQLANDYIKSNEKVWKENYKNRKMAFFNDTLNDTDNTFLINDDSWLVWVREKDYGNNGYYYKYFNWNRGVKNNGHGATIFYMDKKTFDSYQQQISYGYDISYIQYSKELSFKDSYLNRHGCLVEMGHCCDCEYIPENPCLNYYNVISRYYWDKRNIEFKPKNPFDQRIYIPLKMVKVGDELYDGKIVVKVDSKNVYYSVEKTPRNELGLSTVYYSDNSGVAVKYDEKTKNRWDHK